jgi:two-component system response regulator RpaA
MHPRPRILVVDDDADTREVLASALEHAGYFVTTAADGIEAQQLLDAAVPDAIVLDLWLPRLDGAALLARLRGRAQHAQLPVVVVTAAPVSAEVRLGANVVLAKPFDLETLVAALRDLCATSQVSPSPPSDPPP